nr:DUF3362 domain-containing protein [Pseudoramibacter sp. HA2172]
MCPKGGRKNYSAPYCSSGIPKNYQWVKEALISCGRADLIGRGRHVLIAPILLGHIQTNQSKHEKHDKRKADSQDQNQARKQCIRRKETRGKRYGLQTRNKWKKQQQLYRVGRRLYRRNLCELPKRK